MLYRAKDCGCERDIGMSKSKEPQFCEHGRLFEYTKSLGTKAERVGKPRQFSSLKRSTAPETSPAQREKVRGRPCAGCGREGHVDPAHVWRRAHGGCDHPDCVIPLCRTCHRAFDQGELDLLSRFADSEAWAVEQAHPILEHGVGLVELVRRLSGNGQEFVAAGELDRLHARVAELEAGIAA